MHTFMKKSKVWNYYENLTECKRRGKTVVSGMEVGCKFCDSPWGLNLVVETENKYLFGFNFAVRIFQRFDLNIFSAK